VTKTIKEVKMKDMKRKTMTLAFLIILGMSLSVGYGIIAAPTMQGTTRDVWVSDPSMISPIKEELSEADMQKAIEIAIANETVENLFDCGWKVTDLDVLTIMVLPEHDETIGLEVVAHDDNVSRIDPRFERIDTNVETKFGATMTMRKGNTEIRVLMNMEEECVTAIYIITDEMAQMAQEQGSYPNVPYTINKTASLPQNQTSWIDVESGSELGGIYAAGGIYIIERDGNNVTMRLVYTGAIPALTDQEKTLAKDIALDDPDLKRIIAGKEYVMAFGPVVASTGLKTGVSVAIQIPGDKKNTLYFVHVDTENRKVIRIGPPQKTDRTYIIEEG